MGTVSTHMIDLDDGSIKNLLCLFDQLYVAIEKFDARGGDLIPVRVGLAKIIGSCGQSREIFMGPRS